MRLLLALALGLFLLPLPSSAAVPFPGWLSDLKKEAAKKGIGQRGLSALEGLEPIPKVIELDRKQPESRMTFEQYIERVVRPDRIEEGRKLREEHRALLDEVGAKHGVEPEFIVALWGVETSFGRITGDYPVVGALATLAYDGRRSAMFRAQLFDALKIIDQGHISSEAMKGSWAGAMGQCQFMPGTFLAYAVDHDGDGRKDIWGTLPDVFGSTANYLRRIGWKRHLPWGVEVTLPAQFDASLLGVNTRKSGAEWAALGVSAVDGRKLTAFQNSSVIYPAKKAQKVYLVQGNFRSLLRWNRSEFFATAVSMLAEAIAAPGEPGGSVRAD